jgi:hypothetical protein
LPVNITGCANRMAGPVGATNAARIARRAQRR